MSARPGPPQTCESLLTSIGWLGCVIDRPLSGSDQFRRRPVAGAENPRKARWEYKGKRKDLDAAYRQLLQYREALDNPPLLVVCDLDRFEVHTNFTDTTKQVFRFSLADMVHDAREPLRVLRAVMSSPAELRPSATRNDLTADAASSGRCPASRSARAVAR